MPPHAKSFCTLRMHGKSTHTAGALTGKKKRQQLKDRELRQEARLLMIKPADDERRLQKS
jgi:hypothetical protein